MNHSPPQAAGYQAQASPKKRPKGRGIKPEKRLKKIVIPTHFFRHPRSPSPVIPGLTGDPWNGF